MELAIRQHRFIETAAKLGHVFDDQHMNPVAYARLDVVGLRAPKVDRTGGARVFAMVWTAVWHE